MLLSWHFGFGQGSQNVSYTRLLSPRPINSSRSATSSQTTDYWLNWTFEEMCGATKAGGKQLTFKIVNYVCTKRGG
jgi:hypothetical protein